MKALLIPLILGFAVSSGAQTSKQVEEVLSDPGANGRFAIVTRKNGGEWVPLAKGHAIYSNSEKYQWEQIPGELKGTHFLAFPIHHGVLEFEVASDGFIFMVTSTRWGGGGNSSGDWQDEVMLEKDLRRAGWRELKGIDELIATDPGEMAIFWREGKRGETFRIRTEKYVAPMLLIRPVL